MKRLLIDISHILKQCMFAAHNTDSATFVEFEGETVTIPDAYEGYEIFLTSYMKTLRELRMVPSQTVLVKDGARCKELRRQFLPGYCVKPKGAPEWIQQYYKAQDMVEKTILSYGSLSVVKDGYEADDLLAALVGDSNIIWSGDKDLLAAGNVYFKGVMNEDKFLGIGKEFIVVYKSLVGDNSDKIPGVTGLGVKTFIKMLTEYGEECLPDIKKMLETEDFSELEPLRDEFIGFKKILDDQEQAVNSYKCAKFYHPGYDLQWKAAYPEGNGDLRQWEPVNKLITKDLLTNEFLAGLHKQLREAPFNSLDIETYTTPQGDAWMEANKSKQGKKPLDVLGSELAGFSITTGINNHISYYFPVAHADTDNITMEQADSILCSLPKERENIPVIIQNANFELAVLRQHFELDFDQGFLPAPLYDTMIMAGYVDENSPSGLKPNSKRWLGYDQTTYEEVLGDKNKMSELSGKEVLSYGLDDTICTAALYRQYRLIMEYEESWDCYEEVDMYMPFIYTQRYLSGVKFDLDKLDELQKAGQEKYEKLYKKIQEFLTCLKWTEEIEISPLKKKITIHDLKNLKKGAKQEAPVYKKVTHTWPGCVFEPAFDLSPKEIKRLYKVYTGKDLKCRARKLEKLAEAAVDFPEFAQFVSDGDLNGLNELVSDSFKPNPELNLGSPKQLTSLLYDWLGLPVRVRGKVSEIMRAKGQKQGNPAGNESALRHAIVYDLQEDKEAIEFIENIIEAKSCMTEDKLYFRPYKKMPHYLDNRVHPQFKISAQKSGRGTASMPNDAQVAKNSGVRDIYTPWDNNYLWVSLDLSSQELTHTAWHCQDENMMNCFRGDRQDIHSKTGTAIYNLSGHGMSYEEFNQRRKVEQEFKDIRNKKAKPTNFLKNYGGTYQTLAIDLLISEEEAERMLDAQSATFPGVDIWIEKMQEVNTARGYAVTPLGRRRHLSNVLNGSYTDKHALRAAGNHPIQGGAAEQVKLVLKRLWIEKVFENFDAYFMGTVHDEVNAIVRRYQVLDYIKEVHPIVCQDYADIGLEFKSSIEIGTNFGDLVEIGDEIDEEAILKLVEELK